MATRIGSGGGGGGAPTRPRARANIAAAALACTAALSCCWWWAGAAGALYPSTLYASAPLRGDASRDFSLAAITADIGRWHPSHGGGQMALAGYLAVTGEIAACAPSNVLVFGLGADSAFYIRANRGRPVTFVEESLEWIGRVGLPRALARVVHYAYDAATVAVRDTQRILAGPRDGWEAALFMGDLPPDVLATRWDVVFVDAPSGWSDESPGRLRSLYTAARLAGAAAAGAGAVAAAARHPRCPRRDRGVSTVVFVHDVFRATEAAGVAAFFTAPGSGLAVNVTSTAENLLRIEVMAAAG